MAFVAPAWKSSFEATAARASVLMPSGVIQWGLDDQEVVFQAYGVPYQPVTVLIGADGTVVDSWAGVLAESELRNAIEALLTS